MAEVAQTHHAIGRLRGLRTLEQRFRFTGEGATADEIAAVLLTAPITGGGSIFGERPGKLATRTEASWTLVGFSPAPGFRFDVHLDRQSQSLFLVRFSQPDRNTPYLAGEFVWSITDEGDGAVLDEQINTERAAEVVSEPLTGPRSSIRRWLFFRVGHPQVMRRATGNVATLVRREG